MLVGAAGEFPEDLHFTFTDFHFTFTAHQSIRDESIEIKLNRAIEACSMQFNIIYYQM